MPQSSNKGMVLCCLSATMENYILCPKRGQNIRFIKVVNDKILFLSYILLPSSGVHDLAPGNN